MWLSTAGWPLKGRKKRRTLMVSLLQSIGMGRTTEQVPMWQGNIQEK